jgi:outer membrane protein OmpA-like peptidoglycan-associated protein
MKKIILMQRILMSLLLILCITTNTNAQQITAPKVWFGISGAANFNQYSGTTQTLNSSTKAPTAFHDAKGVGAYVAALLELTPSKVWGMRLNVGYDNRSAKFDDVIAPCNCPATLNTKLSYISIEPSLRIAPFANSFYLFAGPTISFNQSKSFVYTQEKQTDQSGDLSDVNSTLFSGQIGAGIDIPLSSPTSLNQASLSPFISYHPYFGQNPRSIENLSITTLRTGLSLKFGKGTVAPTVTTPSAPVAEVVVPKKIDSGQILFSILSAPIVSAQLNIKENFPLRNYVFFDEGSNDISSRYVKLSKYQASSFQKGTFQLPEPENLSRRSNRQLSAYYNLLNIVGDRMRLNPESKISLIGSSAGKGPNAGVLLAEAVKKYLVDIFEIKSNRIYTEGRNQPFIPSEQPNSTTDLSLRMDGDRRVEIVSNFPYLLKPLSLTSIENKTYENMIVFKTQPTQYERLQTWSMEVKDNNGKIKFFGPFTSNETSIPGNSILDNRKVADYKVTMRGYTTDNKLIVRESNLHLSRDSQIMREGLRFSILFDYDKSYTDVSYEKFLNDVVTPLVTNNSTIIIHGHTDILGDKDYNQKLSQKRAEETQRILEAKLAAKNITGTKFKTIGVGEDESLAPFENKYPEERFYNRTVIIDIIPN